MIRDRLTIGAERDRGSFGMTGLLPSHTDIIKKVVYNALVILSVLFDGLIWRSCLDQDSVRHVDYYIKPLLLTQDSKFTATIKIVCYSADPVQVCHAVIAFLFDSTWAGTA